MNISLKATINSGAALVIFILGFFGLTFMAAYYEPIERLYAVALAGWTGAVSFFWIKRNLNNKLRLESEKARLEVECQDAVKGDPLS